MPFHPIPNKQNNISMKNITIITASTLASLVIPFQTTDAHTSYGGTARNLGPNVETAPGSGTFVPGVITGATVATPYFKTITNQTVTSDHGWAHGTRPQFGDAHAIRAFRFTLAEAGLATINVTADPLRGSSGGIPITPAFSLYSGLLSTGSADYDTAPITLAWLGTLGGIQPRAGALNSLGDWKMGNITSVADGGGNFNFSELSSLNYIANAADGTPANYGLNADIQGDGLEDGSITRSFHLAPGNYTVILGGADLDGTNISTFGFNASLTVVPEPSAFLLSVPSCLLLLKRKRA
jgi:hypothetical protein